MSKYLTGLLIILLVVAIGIMASAMLQQSFTAQTVAQTAQTQAEAYVWREYNQTLQTLYSMMTLGCAGAIFLTVGSGFVAYRTINLKQQKPQGRWVSGSNAYWGRAGEQPQHSAMRIKQSQRHLPQGDDPNYPSYLPQTVYFPAPRQGYQDYVQPLVLYTPNSQEDDPNGMLDGMFFEED